MSENLRFARERRLAACAPFLNRSMSLVLLSFIVTLVPSVLHLPGFVQVASADPIGCLTRARLFSAPLTDPVITPIPVDPDETKKLSRREFGTLPVLHPSGATLLPKGTELNVVVEPACLTSRAQKPPELPFLKNLAKKIRPRSGQGPHMSYHWTLEEDWEFQQLQDALEREKCVYLASPEAKFYLNAQFNDPYVSDQSHLMSLKYSQAIDDFFLPMMIRNKVVIAVVDTGVDFNHSDLKLNRWKNPKEIPGNNRDDDRDGQVDDIDGYNFASDSNVTGPEGDWPENKHGTHVAGLAAARANNNVGGIGINGSAQVMSLNVFGRNGYSRSSILENAIRYAADHRADVINMSLGGREYSRSMRSALQYAVRKGSLLITAAGNDGIELCDDPTSFDFISPAVYGVSIPGMLTTGSVDAFNGRLSLFSNYSPRLVEITAPGAFSSEGQLRGLLSTTPKETYGYLAGTSMAAPVLSGAASLVIAYLETYGYSASPQRLERILLESARKEPLLERAIQQGRTLDLVELARYLKTNYPPRTPVSRR